MVWQPGDFKDRMTFSVRSEGGSGGDEYGNDEGGWVDQFSEYAKLLPLRGGEAVMSARLEGKQPYVVTVRSNERTRQITTDWRIVNANDATQVLNVRSVTPSPAGDLIDLICEQGVAV